MRNLFFCENEAADQLRSVRADKMRSVDQRICLSYRDSTCPQLPKPVISSHKPPSVAVQPSLCRTPKKTQCDSYDIICMRDPACSQCTAAERFNAQPPVKITNPLDSESSWKGFVGLREVID